MYVWREGDPGETKRAGAHNYGPTLVNTNGYGDNGIRGICQNVELLLYPVCVFIKLLYFYRQFLVSAASEKDDFFLGKSQKLVKLSLSLNAQPSGCI